MKLMSEAESETKPRYQYRTGGVEACAHCSKG
jgi:hypothetical protein